MNHVARPAQRMRHQNRLRLLSVVHAETLSPRLRRIVLGGGLEGFTTGSFDDHVKLFLPEPGAERPVLPQMGPDGPVFPSDGARPILRDYTPRRYDPVAGTLTIDFVLHAHGPASDWARAAAPGHMVGVGGPRGSSIVPEGYAAYLMVGDETALPAISRRLEEMAPGAVAMVVIEVEDAAEERHLPSAGAAAVTWLHRKGAPAGDPSLLLQAVRAMVLPNDVHGWIAAEIETARAIRHHLVAERGWNRADIRAAGYWRLGASGAHERLDD